MTLAIRHAEPADYDAVIAVLDDWWDGRQMHDMLPRLFFMHFRETSFVAEVSGKLAGFLVGFLSQTFPDEAYVHFAGVAPASRGAGVARALYERFFAAAQTHRRTVVRCVTSPANEGSIAFHARLGFEAGPPLSGYDGPGEDRVLLSKRL